MNINVTLNKEPARSISSLIIQNAFCATPHVVPDQATVITRNIYIQRITRKVRSLGKADTRWGTQLTRTHAYKTRTSLMKLRIIYQILHTAL